MREEIGELHPVEREITLVPFLAPLLDEERKQLGILPGAAGIGLALIPNDAFDAIAQGRVEDPAKNIPRTGIAAEPLLRRLRAPWLGLVLGSSLLRVLPPFRELLNR